MSRILPLVLCRFDISKVSFSLVSYYCFSFMVSEELELVDACVALGCWEMDGTR